MRMPLFALIVVIAWSSPCTLSAAEDAARDESISFISDLIQVCLNSGEKPSAWVDVLGQKHAYPIQKVDAKIVTVLLDGNPFPVKWTEIPSSDLVKIAQSIAGEHGERLLVACEVAISMNCPDQATEILVKARELDPALEPKIKRLAAELNAMQPVKTPAKATPGVKADPAKPSAPATASSGPALPPVTGATLQVGPSRALKTIASAVEKAGPGTTILIDPGTYNEAVHLNKNGQAGAPITLRGVSGADGARPVLDGTGVSVSGFRSTPRALIQVEGDYYCVENLEMKNARNGNNGAGIRLLGCHFTTVRNCKVTYCDMGIQGGDEETFLLERSEIAFNGTKDFDGYSHNFYLMGNRTVIRYCHIHDSLFGQNVKTRGHYTELWYNLIADSEEGEIGPVDGGARTAAANSNFLMVGNVVISKPNRKGNPSKYIDFGADGADGAKHDGTIFIYNNTFIAGTPRVCFLRLSTDKSKGVVSNNIFIGSDKVVGEKGAGLKGTNNFFSAGGAAELGNSMKGDPGFVDAAKHNFHLGGSSPCRGRGLEAKNLEYIDGDGKPQIATPDRQSVFPFGDEPRPAKGPLSLGAFD